MASTISLDSPAHKSSKSLSTEQSCISTKMLQITMLQICDETMVTQIRLLIMLIGTHPVVDELCL